MSNYFKSIQELVETHWQFNELISEVKAKTGVSLSECEKTYLTLILYGLSVSEMAAILGIAEPTVRNNLSRLYESFKDYLEDWVTEEERFLPWKADTRVREPRVLQALVGRAGYRKEMR